MKILNNVINKMKVNHDNPVIYYLESEYNYLIINDLIGKTLRISFAGYECLNCKKNKKIQAMGYCFDCFFKIPETGNYILKPELSTAHLGIEDRNLEFEQKIQLQPHIVYLANSGGLKVGVTRQSQIPYRWIDQGAEQAIPFFRTPNRYLAGMIEVEYKKHLSDKTNWRKMLVEKTPYIDLYQEKLKLKNIIPDEYNQYYIEDKEIYEINYPVNKYLDKVKSVNLLKNPIFEGKLQGIKAQYLIFDNFVFNWRSHEGYKIEIEII